MNVSWESSVSALKDLSIRDGVRRAYTVAAEKPQSPHPFPLGHKFAESLGYPRDLLRGLPQVSVEVFAGVSNVAVFADIPTGATVLDLGCGGGLDAIIASRRTGPNGKVICVDFSQAMLDRAKQGAAAAGARNVDFHLADAERLPVGDGSVDIVLANGIFNLNPARDSIFRELARVIRPGGMVFGAELILREALPSEVGADSANWFA